MGKFLIENEFDGNVSILNSLIAMYIKFGKIVSGRRVFCDMPKRDIVSWNMLITANAWNGFLLACGQIGDLDLGISIHGHLISTGLMSDIRLGTVILDMYAKCDRVDCSKTIFEEELSDKSLVSWNS